MTEQQQHIVRVLLWFADDLAARHYPAAGALRQLARQVATLDVAAVHEDRCGCGAVIVQPATGRPRKACYSCSPRRKTRGKRETPPGSAPDKGAA